MTVYWDKSHINQPQPQPTSQNGVQTKITINKISMCNQVQKFQIIIRIFL